MEEDEIDEDENGFNFYQEEEKDNFNSLGINEMRNESFHIKEFDLN